MRNTKFVFLGLFIGIYALSLAPVEAEPIVLTVDEVIQEESQWCWAASSTAVLNYYVEENIQQCEVAEYTRTVADWYDFGSVDCCVSADFGCDYWNYFWYYDGSIEDILRYWGIKTRKRSSPLTLDEVNKEMENETPFVFRWGWYSGGGHFLVMHGVDDNTVYYMDPWIGEGYSVALYEWVVDDGVHEWTSSMKTSIEHEGHYGPKESEEKGT